MGERGCDAESSMDEEEEEEEVDTGDEERPPNVLETKRITFRLMEVSFTCHMTSLRIAQNTIPLSSEEVMQADTHHQRAAHLGPPV